MDLLINFQKEIEPLRLSEPAHYGGINNGSNGIS